MSIIKNLVVPTKDYIRHNKKLVSMRETQYDDVYVLKYSKKVFFKYLWDETLVQCRGTLVDSDLNIVSRPFTKIFNHDEKFAPKFNDDETVIVDDKINGFMACATWHDGELIVSTTGTTWSEYADVAKEEILKSLKVDMFKDNPNWSFIFEICTPDDTHIIEEKIGIYLLGARIKEWSNTKFDMGYTGLSELILKYATYGDDCSVYLPERTIMTYKDVKARLKDYKREGFVVTSVEDFSKQIKMKSPYYLVTKFLSRLNNDRMDRLLANPERCKEKIDEEFYPIVDYLNYNLDWFKSLSNEEKPAVIREFFNS